MNEIIRICMMYTLFAWDCSSIGQSTALSRRKLRVRAPSVPMDPNTIKKIHQFISSFSLKGRTNSRISFPLGMLSYFIYLFFSFHISHQRNMGIPIYSTSTDWKAKGICKLVQLLVEAYSGFQEIPYGVRLFRLFPICVM